jgi:transcriptional regulator with XRE-family HTH domain
MNTNKEKFQSLVSGEKTNTAKRNRDRIKNRARLRESQDIAMKVLDKLDELGWSKKRLADEMGVSPQQVTKIVRGTENLTLETQVKLQEILNIPILASFYERGIENLLEVITLMFSEPYEPPKKSELKEEITLGGKEIKMSYDKETSSYYKDGNHNLTG